MLELKSITLQGFISFDSPVTIEFSYQGNGLHYVLGENKVDIDLEGNGAGKSSILKGVCWIFFGKTPEELKAGDVKNWHGKKPCEGSASFVIDENEYVLKRTWKPNKLLLSKNGSEFKNKTEEDIVDLIGLDFNSFSYSVAISQTTAKFFDLRPSEKMKVFADIMEDSLKVWGDCSDKAKDKRDELKTKISSKDNELSNLQGKLESLQGIDYTKEKEEWEENKEKEKEELFDRLDSLESKYKESKKEKKTVKVKLEKTKEKLEQCVTKINSTKEKIKDLQNKYDKQKEQKDANTVLLNEAKREKDIINFEINRTEKEWNNFNNLKGECPYCEQSISEEYLHTKLITLQKAIDKNKETNLKKINKKIKTLLDAQSVIDMVLNEIHNKKSDLKDGVSNLNDKKYKLKTNKITFDQEFDTLTCRIESYKEDINRALDKIDKIDNKPNKFEEKEKENIRNINKIEKNIKNVSKDISSLKKNYDIYDYWVKGFKDIRLIVVSEALFELEVSINNTLQQLGMGNWNVKLEVDSENKNGTVKKGFTVLVKSPRNDELKPFKCWSGGEGQRLKLAGTLALIEFIQNRRNMKWNVEFYDEPSQFMSKKGINSFLDILHERPDEVNKNIFIIDHRDFDDFGKFSSTIKVIKDEKGSSVFVNNK